MQVSINTRYDFKFTDTNNFDSLNGIYLVEQTLLYVGLIDTEIDLYESLYAKLDLQKADFETDIGNHINGIFYKLVSVVDQSVIWMPEGLIVSYPDPDVQEYKLVALSTDLGVFDDPATLVSIKTNVHNFIKAKVGSAAEPNTAIVVYSTEWLTKVQYDARVTARVDARNDVNNNTTIDSDIKDWHKEYIDKVAENVNLTDRITALESIINDI